MARHSIAALAVRASLALSLLGCGTSAPRPRSAPAAAPPARLVVLPGVVGTDVDTAAFTPDGGTLLAAGPDVVYALDPRTLDVRGAVHARGPAIIAGGTVLIGDRIWHVAEDRVLALEPRPPARASSISPRRERVARLYDSSVVLVDLRRGSERELPVDAGTDGVLLVGEDRLLVHDRAAGSALIDTGTGRLVARIGEGAIAMHATLPLFVRRASDARIAVHDAADGRVLRELESPDPDRSLTIEPVQDIDGRIVGSTYARGYGRERRLYAWDAATGALIGRISDADRYARVPGSEVRYRVGDDGCALMRIEGDQETTVVEEDSALREYECGTVVLSPDGTVGALSQLGLRTFDARTGAILAEASAPTELGSCGELTTSIEHGLVIPTSRHERELAGCTREEHREEDEYVHDDIDASGTVGRSASGRYVVEARATDDADAEADEWEASLAVCDRQAGEEAGCTEVPELVVRCMLSRDHTPEGGWYSSDECLGRAIVSDDGATLYFHYAEPRVSIVELRTGRRRDVPVPARHGDIELIAPGALLFQGDRRAALIRLDDATTMPSTSRIDRSRGGLLALTTEAAVRIVDPRTFEARDVPREAAASERWRFSADGSTLVRHEPAAPLERIDVARAAPLEPVELPAGFALGDALFGDDGRSLVQCVEGEIRALDLDDLSLRTIAEDPWCTAALSTGFGGVIAIGYPGRATLVRSDGARLSLEAIAYGQRLLWIARSDEGHFWAPADALDVLMVRPAGELEAEVGSAQHSEMYRPELLGDFLHERRPAQDRAELRLQ